MSQPATTESAPLTPLDQARGAVFCATLILCALAYSLRLTSFLVAKEAALCAGLCLITLLALIREWGRFSNLPSGRSGRGGRWCASEGIAAFFPFWLLLAGAACIHLVTALCQVPSDAVMEIVRASVLLLTVASIFDLLRNDSWRNRILDTIILSATLAAILGIAQYFHFLQTLFPIFPGYAQRVYSVFGNQDLFGGYLAVAIAVLLSRFPKKPVWGRLSNLPSGRGRGGRTGISFFAALAILTAGLLLSGSRSAWLAAALGGLFTVLSATRKWPHKRVIALLGVVGLAVLATTVLAPEATIQRITGTFQPHDHGARLRLWFWDGTLRMIRAQGILGVGPGNFAYWSPRYLGETLHAPGGASYEHNELLVDHPHCEPLQILAEFGILGVVCCAWMLLRLLWRGGPEWGGLIALLVFSLFNAPFHSAPHALVGLTLTGMVLAKPSVQKATPYVAGAGHVAPIYNGSRFHVGALAAFTLALAMTAFFTWAVFPPSAWLRAAKKEHLAGRPPFALYERCVRHPWPNAGAQVKYGIALLEAQRYPEARQAFLAALAGVDSGEVYLGLAIVEARGGRAAEARHWVEECLWRWPSSRDAWALLAEVSPESERPAVLSDASEWLSAEDFERVQAYSDETGNMDFKDEVDSADP